MHLKLAYVAFLPQTSTGVEKALHEKAQAFASLDADIDVFVVQGGTDRKEGRVNVVGLRPHIHRLLLYPLTVLSRYRVIEKAVDLDPYDLVILRYPAADASGPSFATRFAIITEHHSRMVPEMESYFQTNISFPVRIMKSLRLRLERRYGGRTLRRCRGLIGVTDEIRNSERSRAGAEVPTITVPNGIDVTSITPSGCVSFSGRELHIAFVASTLRPWHGLDRLTSGLQQYQGAVRITLHLVGNIPRSDTIIVGTPRVTTVFHGTCVGPELDEILGRMTLAASSLGLHRNNMGEACVLKTREYTARGLPFILGYHDPDLAQAEQERLFFLSVPLDDTPVDIYDVICFARRLASDSGAPPVSELMRSYALEHMDWRAKMEKYIEFCENLAERN